MLCIINCQYTHNQGKFCQNFQFFHMYTSFSVNLHHFTVTKPKFRSKLPKFRSGKPKFRSECNEISFFEFKYPFRSELPKFSEISPGIPFPPDGGIRSKNEKENPGHHQQSSRGLEAELIRVAPVRNPQPSLLRENRACFVLMPPILTMDNKTTTTTIIEPG